MEQHAGDLKDNYYIYFIKQYFDANGDAFAKYILLNLNIGAAASFDSKHHMANLKVNIPLSSGCDCNGKPKER